MKHSLPTPSRTRGFTLIETLVALLVLSIGLLGVAALQLSSLRANQGAAMRSQATFLAYDILDRMRSNRLAAIAGGYDIALGAAGGTGSQAADDLTAWKASLNTTLPSGDGSVARNGNVFTVSVVWDSARDTNDEIGSVTTGQQLTTFTMQTQHLN